MDKLLETHCKTLEESYYANGILARNTVEELENLLEEIFPRFIKVGPLLEELASQGN